MELDWKPIHSPVNWYERHSVDWTSIEMAKPLLERRLVHILNYYPCGTWPRHWHVPWQCFHYPRMDCIVTVSDLIRLTENELLERRGIGPKMVSEIKAFLAENDLSLRILDIDDLIDMDILREPPESLA